MDKVFGPLAERLAAGQATMLLCQVASTGSAPGGLGARMLVGPEGRLAGTVGGGPAENGAITRAMALLAEGQSELRPFTMCHTEKADGCAGGITVFSLYLAATAQNAAFAKAAAECFAAARDTWLYLCLSPGAADAALLSEPGGLFTLCGEGGPLATLGAGQLRPLAQNGAVIQTSGGHEVYCEPMARAGRAVVFGGGHVGQALVPMLSTLGFYTVLFDDRPEFANREVFPSADEVMLGDFDNIAAHLALNPQDCIIAVTRGHGADFELLRQVLAAPHAYVGLLGSRRKMAGLGPQLLGAGVSEAALAQVHSPIGLDIGAETPAEVALSIVAELVMLRAKRRKEGANE